MNSNQNNLELNLEKLIGKNYDDDEILQILNLCPNYKEKEINNINNMRYFYVTFVDYGFSFCFRNKVLDCIFLYREGYQGFKQFKGEIPYKISWDYKNKNIVEYLGDTKIKQGGNVQVWLSYPHLGIEFTFLGKSWSDLENPIVMINIFKKENKEIFCSVCLNNIISISESLKCDNNCTIVSYCSSKCKQIHSTFHKQYCI